MEFTNSDNHFLVHLQSTNMDTGQG